MTTNPPAGLELRDVRPSDPWRTVALAGRLISPKVGLLRSVGATLYRAQDPLSLSMGVTMSNLANFSDIENASKAGGGGEDFATAMAATLGEAVERYCMLFYDKSEMVLASYREVESAAVAPDLLRLYSREQVENKGPNVRLDYFDEEARIRWVWGYSLTRRQPRLVPATMVYLQYALDDDEQAPGRNASTGLAAGSTLEEAILTGLYEVIERDAFTICWLHRRVGYRLLVDDPELSSRMRTCFYCEHPRVDLRFFDITLDISVPSVFAMMRRPAEFGPALCVSSVTRLSPREMVRKALREVGQGLSYLRYLLHQLRDWQPAPDFSDLRTFDHHCTLYAKRPELIPAALAFCEETPGEQALSQVPDRSSAGVRANIERCVEMLDRAGDFEVIVVDITTPDVRDLDLHVVRVLVPGLVPLHGNHSFPYLGVRRLWELPRKLGWEASGWDPIAGLNPYPHPFP